MSRQHLLTEVTKDNTKEFYPVTLPSNTGSIIINVNEDLFTDKMKRELAALSFSFYTSDNCDVDPDDIIIENQTYLWNKGADNSIRVSALPISCFVRVSIIRDEYLRFATPGYKYEDSYPIEIIFDNSDVGNIDGSHGASESNTTVQTHRLNNSIADLTDRSSTSEISEAVGGLVGFEEIITHFRSNFNFILMDPSDEYTSNTVLVSSNGSDSITISIAYQLEETMVDGNTGYNQSYKTVVISRDSSGKFSARTNTQTLFQNASKEKLDGIEYNAEVNIIEKVNVKQTASSAYKQLIPNTSGYNTERAVFLDLSKKADLVDGLVPSDQLPSYVDDVLECSTYSNLPKQGEKGKIYILTGVSGNPRYRWSGSTYIEISEHERIAYEHTLNRNNPHDNTSFKNANLTGETSIEKGTLDEMISASESDTDIKRLIDSKKIELQSSIAGWDIEGSEENSLYNKQLNDYVETVLREKNNKSLINREYVDNIVNPQEGAGYQPKIDNNLNTDSKTIVGAINEVSERVNTVKAILTSGWNTVSINTLYPVNWRFFSKPYCYDEDGNTVDFRIRNYQNNIQNNEHCFEIYVPVDCTVNFATTKEDDISGYDMKYLVLTYYYIGVDGKDLDTVTEISNDNWTLNRTVGYGHSNSITNSNGVSLVEFGGDNTGGGTGSASDRYYESIYLNVDAIQSELPDEDIEIVLYATWFSRVDEGNINVSLNCYTCDKIPTITKSNKMIILSSPDSSSTLTKTYENNSEMRCNIPTLKGGAANYKTNYTPAFKITLKRSSKSYRVISIKALS